MLAALWAELLGLERVGAHDDFFALGGDSLLATRLAARVRRAFEVELPLGELLAAPTLAALAARVAAARGTAPATPPLVRGDEVEAPASFAQERMWFLAQLDPGSPVYHLAVPVRLAGALDPAALAGALAALERRHEALRTAFPDRGGRPVQAIRAPRPAGLPLADLMALPAARREPAARAAAAAVVRRPFDLEAGPPLRTALVRLAGDDHLLVVALHHVAGDGWSLELLIREAAVLYRAALAGAPPPLPAPAVRYADWAAWQRRWLAGDVLDAQLGFWRRRLAGGEPLELPADRPRPAVRGRRGGVRERALPPALGARVGALALEEGATRFMVLCAAFQALLHRVCDAAEVRVGTPVAGRGRAEVEGVVGLFVNTLVLSGDAAGDPTFEGFLGRVRRAALDAFAHQDLPFDRLVDALAPERDPARHPLFDVLFTVEAARELRLALPGLELSAWQLPQTTAKFDLALTVRAAGDRLRLALEYSRELFDDTTAERLLRGYEALLAGAVAAPGRRLSELPLMSAAERHQAVREWSDAERPYPRWATIPELFAEWAARTPDAVAAVEGGRCLTYGALARRAGALARRLAAAGVAEEEPVGVAVERSLELVVALLGVLGAGGAYLPLDPAYPPARRALMAEDAGVRVVVAAPGAPPVAGTRALAVLGPAPADGPAAEGPAPARPRPEGLAYVLYTSGSTGRPKGVAVSHRSVIRLVRGTGFARFGPDEVFLLLAPTSFDASTLEMWGPLLNGGRLAVAPPGGRVAGGVSELVRRHRVTALWLTAGLFHQAVEHGAGAFAPVRQLLAGGDVLAPERVAEALAALPGTTLINGYGPTEGTTFTCTHRDALAGRGGGAGADRAADRQHPGARARPPPAAAAGGGRGRAAASAATGSRAATSGRPELTAERFVPDPGSGRPATASTAPATASAGAPTACSSSSAGSTPRSRSAASASSPGRSRRRCAGTRRSPTRRWRRCRRPAATSGWSPSWCRAAPRRSPPSCAPRSPRSSPSTWCRRSSRFLDRLPLGPTGKVDRRALAEPRGGAGAGAAAAAPRRAPPSATLAAIWSEVLGVAEVGVDDDFFDLGGDSILSLQIVHRARRAGLEIQPKQVFQHPTVAGLAAVAGAAAAPPAGPPAAPGPVPLTPVQRWFFALDPPRPEHWNQSLLLAARRDALRPPDPAALRRAVAALAAHHDALRLRFRRGADGWEQRTVASEEAGVPFALVDLAALARGRPPGRARGGRGGAPGRPRPRARAGAPGGALRPRRRGRAAPPGRPPPGDRRRLVADPARRPRDRDARRSRFRRRRCRSGAGPRPSPPGPAPPRPPPSARTGAPPSAARRRALPADGPGGAGTAGGEERVSVGLDAEETAALTGAGARAEETAPCRARPRARRPHRRPRAAPRRRGPRPRASCAGVEPVAHRRLVHRDLPAGAGAAAAAGAGRGAGAGARGARRGARRRRRLRRPALARARRRRAGGGRRDRLQLPRPARRRRARGRRLGGRGRGPRPRARPGVAAALSARRSTPGSPAAG